jgi:hypothetical protein
MVPIGAGRLSGIREIFSASLWERATEINGTPLWLLIRSLPARVNHMFNARPIRH